MNRSPDEGPVRPEVDNGGSVGPLPAAFPFSAVVGQEEAKLALLLNAVEPRIGGVLLRGQKGSAKTTLARGLAALLPGAAPFVELPTGATEDRVVGTLDVTRALTSGERRFEPGLLAAADGGVLYVDEINLLPDHLVDVLLDVAASGVNRIERDGISHAHPSRFVLIGSMNPEEGDLRPQLLDRFGLAATVTASLDPGERALAVRRRLAWDAEPELSAAGWRELEEALAARLRQARSAGLPPAVVDAVSVLCASVEAEGLRADLTICRTAGALAGWEGRAQTSTEDVRRVAHLALAHRARRDPLDPAGIDERRLAAALDAMPEEAGGPREAGEDPAGPGGARSRDPEAGRPEPGGGSPAGGADAGRGSESAGGADASRGVGPGTETEADAGLDPPGPATGPLDLGGGSRHAAAGSDGPGGRRDPASSRRGRVVGDRAPGGESGSVALAATARAAVLRRAGAGDAWLGRPSPGAPLVEAEDLRIAVHEERRAGLIVLAVDASGSMGAERRMVAAKAAVLGLLVDAYQRRDRVALVAFRGEAADVLLRPTSSVEVARARLTELPTGGRTPLAAGLGAACRLIAGVARTAALRPLLVVVTDGRATWAAEGVDPWAAAEAAAAEVRRREIAAVVVDVEGGPVPLGLARRLASVMGARHVALADLTPRALEQVVRAGAG